MLTSILYRFGVKTAFTNHLFKKRKYFLPLSQYYVKGSYSKPFIMKVDTPEFKSVFTNEVITLLDLFEKYNYEIRIAGGAVRDILVGKTPKDVDFATTATPDQMKEMFEAEQIRMINLKGEKHGTITARINNDNFELTTLRIDVTTDGRHAEVQFTTDWLLDSGRRDLTINSMFIDREGTLFDYFGGYQDLQKRRVVFVGDPTKRIQEDYLRILRYFRFYGRISDTPDDHDEETLKALSNNVSGLSRIAGERIWMELTKILSGNFVGAIVKRMLAVGISPFIGFPLVPNIGEFVSVWEKGKNLNLHPMTLVAALMNNEGELKTFHGRCKLSAFERDLGLFIVNHRNKTTEHHLKPYQTLLLKTDGKLVDTKKHIIELFKYKADLQLIHDFEAWDPPKFPINGSVLRELGIPPGKKMGFVLRQLKEYWIDKDFEPKEEELLSMVPELVKDIKLTK